MSGCHQACQKAKGCSAFDLSPIEGKKKLSCLLYGHKEVNPASGLKGNCYRMGEGDESLEEEEEDEEIFVDVTGDVQLSLIGEGACR